MQLTARHPKIVVSADGTGIVSQAGGLLLAQTLGATGLDRGLATALEPWRPPRAVHAPGKIVADLERLMISGRLPDAALRLHPGVPGQSASAHPEPAVTARLL